MKTFKILKKYLSHEIEIDFFNMICDVTKIIPSTLNLIKKLYSHADPIVETLIEQEYMNKKDGELLLSELIGLENNLTEMNGFLGKNTIHYFPVPIPTYIFYTNKIRKVAQSIFGNFSNIRDYTYDLFRIFKKNLDAHGLNTVIQALSTGSNKFYVSGDMYIPRSQNGNEVKVNLSSLTRVYTKALAILESKKDYLRLLKLNYKKQYINGFLHRKNKIVANMDHMEMNPRHFQQHVLGNFTPNSNTVYNLSKIIVHDHFPFFPDLGFTAAFNNMFSFIESEINKMKDVLEEQSRKLYLLTDRK